MSHTLLCRCALGSPWGLVHLLRAASSSSGPLGLSLSLRLESDRLPIPAPHWHRDNKASCLFMVTPGLPVFIFIVLGEISLEWERDSRAGEDWTN